MDKGQRKERWKATTFDILSMKKNALELHILKMCHDFEKDVGLEIEGIGMITIDPILKGKNEFHLRKLINIEIKLTIEL